MNLIDFAISGCKFATDEMFDLESLFRLSKKSILEEHRLAKEKYKNGSVIAELLDELSKTGDNEKKTKIKSILETALPDGRKVSDILDLLDFNDKSIIYSIDFKIKDKEYVDPVKARNIRVHYNLMLKLNVSSTLSNAVLIYEKYLSYIYKELIFFHREKYFENKTITIQEILSNDINDLLEEKMTEIVECDMFDSISTLNKIFTKEKINLSDARDILNIFSESYYRRNAYVHNNGFVNKRYLNGVKQSNFKVGEYLRCTASYMDEMFTNIQKLIFYISYSIMSNEKFEDQEINELFIYYFDLLSRERYKLCEYVYKQLSLCKYLKLSDRMIAEVNYLICLKELDKNAFEKELKTFDVSAAEDKFKIAKLMLQEKYNDGLKLIKDNYNKNQTPRELMEWPLYKYFRLTKEYDGFVKEHVQDFSILETQAK